MIWCFRPIQTVLHLLEEVSFTFCIYLDCFIEYSTLILRDFDTDFLAGNDDNFLNNQRRKQGSSLKTFLTYIKEEYLPMVGLGARKSF